MSLIIILQLHPYLYILPHHSFGEYLYKPEKINIQLKHVIRIIDNKKSMKYTGI